VLFALARIPEISLCGAVSTSNQDEDFSRIFEGHWHGYQRASNEEFKP
jgi:hypothetical protein